MIKYLSRLLAEMSGYKKEEGAAGFLILLNILGGLAVPFLFQNIIDLGILKNDFNRLLYFAVLTLFVVLLQNVCSFCSTYIYAAIKMKYTTSLKIKLLDKIGKMDGKELSSMKTGTMLNILQRDVDNIGDTVSMVLFHIISDIVLAVFVFFILIKQNIELLAIILFLQFLLININVKLSNSIKEKHKMFSKSNDSRVSLLEEYLSNILNLVKMNLQSFLIKKFGDKDKVSERDLLKIISLSSVNSNVANFIVLLTTLTIWGYGGYKVIKGEMTLGGIYAFSMYTDKFLAPVIRLAKVNEDLKSTFISMDRISEVLNFKMKKNIDQVKNSKQVKGDIAFQHVNFIYGNNTRILSDFSAVFEENKITAIVGPSGSGKTTIVNLLLRMWEPGEGIITINNKEISEYEIVSELRDSISLVSQEILIFHDTIWNNIVLDKEVPLEKVIEVTKKVGIYKYIESLEDGFYTVVSEKGSNFSGGQRQKIALARALIKESSILILDEATANLDNSSEYIIGDMIFGDLKDKTVIIISHRLPFVERADKIIVMSHGKIVEEGTHEKLIENKRQYYKMYMQYDKEKKIS